MEYNLEVKAFKDLSVDELYDILSLREQVFAIEQNSVYTDLDYLDQKCFHVIMTDKESGKLASYCRVVPVDVKDSDYQYIGRVITSKQYRRQGLGKTIMEAAITQALQYPHPIKVIGQAYLEEFYASLGFRAISEVYLYENIDHIDFVMDC
jgi:ElaA protein